MWKKGMGEIVSGHIMFLADASVFELCSCTAQAQYAEWIWLLLLSSRSGSVSSDGLAAQIVVHSVNQPLNDQLVPMQYQLWPDA